MERQSFWHVLELLKLKTNEEEGLSIKEIQSSLEARYGVKRTRQTIRQDIEAFKALGFDIREVSRHHNEYIYQLVDREFTYDEVRILVDSVCINQFLTWHQKKEIIDKFDTLISTRDVGKLKSIIKINDCIDPNINLLENLKELHLAIPDSLVITFHYGRYNEKKQFTLKEKVYHVIPKEIIYQQNRYYLIGVDLDEEKKIKYYRIDRMMAIQSGAKCEDHTKINLEQFDVRTFDMFTSEKTERVSLRVHKKLIDLMIERFGINVTIVPDFDHEDYVIVHQEMGRSEGLMRWLLNQGSMIEVLGPPDLRKEIKTEIEKMLHYYDE